MPYYGLGLAIFFRKNNPTVGYISYNPNRLHLNPPKVGKKCRLQPIYEPLILTSVPGHPSDVGCRMGAEGSVRSMLENYP